MEFDRLISKEFDSRKVPSLPAEASTLRFGRKTMIDYGIVDGNSTIIFVKAGQNGSVCGYKNKYIRLARKLNEKYGCSVICSSNPYDGNNPLDNAFEIVEDYVRSKNYAEYRLYYIGYSAGATIGVKFAVNYTQIQRLLLVNAPLRNIGLINKNVPNFKGEKLTFAYGTKDVSYSKIDLLESLKAINNIQISIVEGADHHFSQNEDDFFLLPEKYLLYDR